MKKTTYKQLGEKCLFVIEKVDFSVPGLLEKEYERTEFKDCTFSDLSDILFAETQFTSCNLSNASVAGSKMQNIFLKDCKMVGINLSEVNDFFFEVHFENCLLDYTDFENLKVGKSTFKNCMFHGANLSGADFSEAIIENCDFLNAVFNNTNLKGVDFSSNYNFIIHPAHNNIRKAKFSGHSLHGLLASFDILIEE